MDTSWHAFDLATGRRGPRLATRTKGAVSRILCEQTDAQVEVRVWDHEHQRPWPEWEIATGPMRSLLVLMDSEETILWGGIVTRRVSTTGTWCTLSLSTCEHYLSRRFVGDLTFAGVDQATIAASLVAAANVDGINLTVDAPASGVLRDRTYADDEDKTVLSCLQDLAGVEGGIEFTVDLDWADGDHKTLTKVLRVRNRIGRTPSSPTSWAFPGSLTSAELVEDRGEENFANDVMATSSGEGETRPESAHMSDAPALAAGWPRVERRFTPSTSITNTATLNAHARRELAVVKDGLSQLSIKARLEAAPRLNVDWWLGDDITVVITSPRHPAYVDADGRMRPGLEATLRTVGWQLDLDAAELTPIAQGAQA